MISRREKKAPTLKYMNIQWLTIPPLSIRPLSSQVSRRISRVQSPANTFRKEEKVYPFTNSSVSFTKKEMDLLNPPEQEVFGSKLTKSPSKLQQLQSEAEARELEKQHLSKQKKSESPKQFQKQKTLEREDSYISINFNYEDEYINEQSLDNIVTQSDEKKLDNTTPAVTHKDIEKSVWLYANSHKEVDTNNRFVQVDGRLIEDDERVVADIRPSRGMTKLRYAISLASPTGDNLEAMSLDKIKTVQQKQEEDNLKEAVSESYTGSKLRDYLDANQLRAPDFIENIAYRNTQARGLEKQKIPADSPRRKALV